MSDQLDPTILSGFLAYVRRYTLQQTQQELADAIGVSRGTISRGEQGHEPPSVAHLTYVMRVAAAHEPSWRLLRAELVVNPLDETTMGDVWGWNGPNS